MVKYKGFVLVIMVVCGLGGCSSEPDKAPRAMNQYPSPMQEAVRRHQHITEKGLGGLRLKVTDVLARPVEVYRPDRRRRAKQADLLIHFHGMGYVPEYAVYHTERAMLLAVVNLGPGSSVYEKAFRDKATFPGMIASIREAVAQKEGAEPGIARIYLSAFSAGYGAVRAILRDHLPDIDGILLLDGLHTGYVPAGRVLAEGGTLDEGKMKDFVCFARLAKEGRKRFLITHSEIFPGRYASTTETANYLIDTLRLKRRGVLEWGPGGMQMLSETGAKGLRILGFAGNSAPDHIDHFHGLPVFLEMMLGP